MSKKLKILFVASPWLGGSGSVAFRIAKHLSLQNNNEVHFLSYEIPFKEKSNSKIIYHKTKGYTYPLFPFPLFELSLAENIVKVVKENNINIIHAHYGILFGHAAALAKNILHQSGCEVKLILTFHGSDAIGFDLEKPGTIVPKELNTWIINCADVVTVASNTLKNLLLKIYRVNREVIIVPNFVNTSVYKPAKKQTNKFNIVHVSNYRKVKQAMVVIKAFELVKRRLNANLTLVGTGPDIAKVKRYMNRKRIKNVKFTGKIKNEETVAKFLKNSDILLLPSLFENFPLVALEAQACGVAVVASNAGGIPEIVLDHKTGLLSKPKDYKQLAINTLSLLKDEKKLKKYSSNARNNAVKYEEGLVVNMYEDLYKDAEARKPRISLNHLKTIPSNLLKPITTYLN